ncbi:MAG: PEP/pyruvate-binding domain-containing protein, partial [Fidelibacterota bacterium]
MFRYILTVDDPEILNKSVSGGKGSSLAGLLKKGFPVPPFFILSVNGYRSFIRRIGIQKRIENLEKILKSYKLDEIREDIKGIKQLIISSKIPQAIRKEIDENLWRLRSGGKGSFSIRSSAISEDSASLSFAGQFKSFLNLHTLDEILQAIKHIWVSLLDDSSIFYHVEKGISISNTKMAVVIQQFIPAQFSGVSFTIDPTTGKERIIIEANWGLGTTVVGGGADIDRYAVSKKDIVIIEKVIGRKTVYSTPGEESSGISEHKIPEDKRDKAVLSDERLRALAIISRDIESKSGAPQDIEWSFFKDKFYILQSRPVTTSIPLYKIETEGKIWTNYFFAERFTQPVSPLGWTILKRYIEKNAFREPLSFLGYRELSRSKITKLFYGRPYTDVEVFHKLYGFFPLKYISEDKRKLILLGKVPEVKINYLSIFVSLFKDLNWIVPVHMKNWKRYIRSYDRKLKG